MEIVFETLKQLPSGWPRIAVLVALGLLYFLPNMRRMLRWRVWSNKRFSVAKQLLELRELEITVGTMKAEHPEMTNEAVDSRIQELFDVGPLETEMPEWIPWTERIKYSLAGSCTLLTLGTIALMRSGRLVGKDPLTALLAELGITVFCGFLASTTAARYRWESVFRGFLIPALLGAVMAAVVGNE